LRISSGGCEYDLSGAPIEMVLRLLRSRAGASSLAKKAHSAWILYNPESYI